MSVACECCVLSDRGHHKRKLQFNLQFAAFLDTSSDPAASNTQNTAILQEISQLTYEKDKYFTCI
jgi:hypothetical protein